MNNQIKQAALRVERRKRENDESLQAARLKEIARATTEARAKELWSKLKVDADVVPFKYQGKTLYGIDIEGRLVSLCYTSRAIILWHNAYTWILCDDLGRSISFEDRELWDHDNLFNASLRERLFYKVYEFARK